MIFLKGFAARRANKCLGSNIYREHRRCHREAKEETGNDCNNGFTQHQTNTENCRHSLPPREWGDC